MIAGSLVGTPSRIRAALRQVGIGPERTTAEVTGLLLAKAAAGFCPAVVLAVGLPLLLGNLLAPFGVEAFRPASKALLHDCLVSPWLATGIATALIVPSGWSAWRIARTPRLTGIALWGALGLGTLLVVATISGMPMALAPRDSEIFRTLLSLYSATMEACASAHDL